MKPMKQLFVEAVKNKDHKQVASLLYLIPELYLCKINNLSLFEYAKQHDSALKPILWGLCPNNKSLHQQLKLEEDSQYSSLGKTKAHVMTHYELSKASNHLSQELWATAAEQLMILLGIEPQTFSQTMKTPQGKQEHERGLKYPIELRDAIAYTHLSFYFQVFGIAYEEVTIRRSYHLQLKPESLRVLFNLFEGTPLPVQHKSFTNKELLQPEKIQAFELCFNSDAYIQQVASRCKNVHQQKLLSHVSASIASWFKQVGADYLSSISHSLAQIDSVNPEFEQEGSLEYFSKRLQLPTPDTLLAQGCSAVDPLRKEILFEMCFMPKEFMRQYLKNLPNDQLSRSEFLESDIVKYQHALRAHVPEAVKQEYANALGLNFIRESKRSGFYVAFEPFQAPQQELANQGPLQYTKRPSM